MKNQRQYLTVRCMAPRHKEAIQGGNCADVGCGTILKLTSNGSGWIFTRLYAFTGGSDGSLPLSSLIPDHDGAFYGNTRQMKQEVTMNCIVARLPMDTVHPLVLLATLLSFLISPVAQRFANCQSEPNRSSAARTIDDFYAEVGERVPAFGGVFVNEENDTLYAYMVPGLAGDAATLDRAITDVLGSGRPGQHLQLIAGQYSFRQLKTWHDRLSSAVQAIPGTVFTDIDDGKNRLEVGVESLTLTASIEAELLALNIPRESVNIVEAPPMRVPASPPDENGALATVYDIGPDGTLRDRFRPLVGGLQIEIAVKGLTPPNVCTMGFNATRAKVPGLVTNDHCIKEHRQQFLKDNVFYQPTEGQENRVATGSVAPEYFRPVDNDKCLSTYKFCRFSDSAFAKLDGNVEAAQGLIAKPQSGSQWDGTTKFRIVSLVKPAMDMSVTRVGAKTGIVEGKVANPCRNVEQLNDRG